MILEERIVIYGQTKQPSWWADKKKGLINRGFAFKRAMGWAIHRRRHPVRLDFSKIRKHSLPIIVNCYNRREPLEAMMQWLITLPNVSLILADNNSDYKPLLDYYQSLDFPNAQVVYLGFNTWKKGAAHLGTLLSDFPKYAVTDPDLLPYETLPNDFLKRLTSVLDAFPHINHVGPSLEINDLPDHNPMKQKILGHESQFWKKSIDFQGITLYESLIDSTFALYRRSSKMEAYGPAFRLGRPYTLKHTDWYMNPNQISEEFKHYLTTCGSFATWAAEMRREHRTIQAVENSEAAREVLP